MSLIQILLAAALAMSAPAQLGKDRLDPNAPPPPVEPITVPLELLAGRPLIRVTINGQGPFPFLIGPETETTLIDPALNEVLKGKERISKEEGVEPTVDLGIGENKPIKVPVQFSDLARIMPEFAAPGRPRGIVSLSVWKDQLVTLDYSRYRLTIAPGALPEPNGKDVFALTPEREFRLPLSIGEQSVECRVDPLFHGSLLLPMTLVDPTQIDRSDRDWSLLSTRAGTIRVKEAHVAADLTLGPFELKSPVVLLASAADVATIGARWLGRFLVTYDLTNARARLERPVPLNSTTLRRN